MENFPSGTPIVQGQPVFQIVEKPTFLPRMQQSVQRNTLPPILPKGCQYTHPNNILTYSGITTPGAMSTLKTVNQANYTAPQVDSSKKVLYWIRGPDCRTNTPNLNAAPGNNQRDQLQNLQFPGQGMSNASMAGNASQTICRNANIANPPGKGVAKIPEPINLNTQVRKKVGSLKIHISESFLPWNITNKTILDLEFMRHLFNISGVDTILTDSQQNEKAMKAAVGQLLQTRILSDWLVLKCEEKEIPFLKVNSQVEIFTISNFTSFLNLISQETCLPLPFITEENSVIKYFYLNFPKTGNDKVKKLNAPIFHIADSGKKKLPCRYPGIRMDCEFENAPKGFTVHVHQSAFHIYQASVSEIRQHLIYRHIIWGFLQMWIRRVKEQYNQCFRFEDISQNLSLCKGEVSQDGKTYASDNAMIYDIDYCNCYLKFDPVALKETKASFSMDNFSTNTVCNLSIVQYYKQFFIINDIRYSDTLKNTVLFFRHCNDKNLRASNYSSLPNPWLAGSVIKSNYPAQQKFMNPLSTTHNVTTNVNLSASTSGIAEFRSTAYGGDNNDVIQVESRQPVKMPAPEKPRLKTRTVEEINSSVELIQKTICNDNPEEPEVQEIIYHKEKDHTQKLNYKSFISLIERFLANCYAANSTEMRASDESYDRKVIERRFDEAVLKAVGVETVEKFIEKIYVYLQMYFTNSTCQSILNKWIWKAIEVKYPHLKEHVSENIAKSMRSGPLTNDKNSRPEHISLFYPESNTQLNMSVIENSGNIYHKDHTYITTLPVKQLLTAKKSNPKPGTCYSGGNDNSARAVSLDDDVVLESVHFRDSSQKKIDEQESPVTSTNDQPKEGENSRDSISLAYKSDSKKSKRGGQKDLSEQCNKELHPYINTLKFVRVSTSPTTFRISRKSESGSAAPSSEMDKNQSCTNKELLTVTPDEVFEIDTPKERDQAVQTIDEMPQEQDQAVQTVDEMSQEQDQAKQTVDEMPQEQDQAKQTVDEMPQEQDQAMQAVERSEEVDEESRCEKDYSIYNLKSCSVVLDRNDVENYMKKYKKRKRREALMKEKDIELDHDYVTRAVRKNYAEEDSDDSDFASGRKRMRRTVSEIQYMEARTRVLQRLRKRKSLFVGYERTRISGEELDSFFVRQGSTSRLSDDEYEEEENESESECKMEKENDCDSDESQSYETEMEKQPAMKELRVVLVRLEETPEYKKYCENLRGSGKSNSGADDLNQENCPPLKNKYFEVKEGKLYLKQGYRICNGVIVPVDEELDPVTPKKEPESPAREIDFDSEYVKVENVLE